MTRPDADRLFATFAQRGDPAALAQVFDLLAGELLLLAAHLAPRGVEAEDLLQATFVCAIEQRAKFDTQRPVRPWLVGILGNLARQARKTAARSADPQRLNLPSDIEPVAQAQTQEMEATVAQALAALPRLDRQVLTLRLVHGLNDAQIAHALAVPLPTAKARLRRGLVRLRQGLPAGLARGMAVFAARGRDLRAVRAEVLAAAAAVAPTTMAVSSVLKVAALLAVLLAGVAFYATRRVTIDPVAPPTPVSLSVPADATESTVSTSHEANEADASPSRVEVVAPRTGLYGRCVARESGAPIGGCAIEARWKHPFPATPDEFAAWQRVARQPLTTTSAADGTFHFEPPPDVAPFGMAITFHAPERASAALSVPRGEATPDLGDVRLARPVPILMSIVDARGHKVVGAGVTFMPESLLNDPGGLQDLVPDRVPSSDADGRLVVQPGLAPGVWRLHVHTHPVITPTALAVEENATRVEVEIVVLRRTADEKLAGVVHDHAGQPLAGVWVTAEGETHAGTTDQHGAFLIQRNTGPSVPSVLRLQDFEGRAALTTVAGPFAWGQTDLVLTMPRIDSVRVRVTDAHSQALVPQFVVQRLPATSVAANPRFAVTQPEPGIAVVPAVEWGLTSVRIVPEGGDYEPSALVVLERRDVVEGELPIRLQRRGELRVRVHHQGAPVVGSTVEVLIDAAPNLPPQSLPVAQLASGWAPLFAAQLDHAVTDATGVAMLRVASASSGRALRVRGNHPEVVRREFAVQPGATIDVAVSAAAIVRGRVGPPEVLRALRAASPPLQAGNPMSALMQFGLIFKPQNGSAAFLPTPLDAEGKFEVGGLSSGRCEVAVQHTFRRGTVRTPLVVLDLHSGEQEVVLDLTPTRPATLHAVVVTGDRPGSAAHVRLHGQPGPSFELHCDPRGTFVVPGLPAGTYRVYLDQRDPETGRSLWIPSAEACELQPAATTHARFHIERRSARVRVLHADGRTPISDRCFLATHTFLLPACRTDADTAGSPSIPLLRVRSRCSSPSSKDRPTGNRPANRRVRWSCRRNK